jgi:hypothetical protein
MKVEVGNLTGAGYGGKSADRLTIATALGRPASAVQLRIPKLRKGSYSRLSGTAPGQSAPAVDRHGSPPLTRRHGAVRAFSYHPRLDANPGSYDYGCVHVSASVVSSQGDIC